MRNNTRAPRSDRAAIGFIYARVRRYLWLVALLAAIGAAGSLCGVWFALMSKRVLDIATGVEPGDLLSTGYLLFAVLIGQVLLGATAQVIVAYVNIKMEMALKSDVLICAVTRRFADIATYHSGDLLNRLVSDVSVVVSGVVGMLPAVVTLSVRLVAAVWALAVLAPSFAATLLAIGLFFVLFRRIFSEKLKFLHKRQQETDGRVRSYFSEVLQNIAVVQAFQAAGFVKARSTQLQRAMQKSRMARTVFATLASIATQLTFSGAYYLTVLWGAFSISRGEITFGTLTALLQLVNQVQGPLYGASGMISQYYGMIASAERLIEITALKEDALPRSVGTVDALVCEDVRFGYEEGESVLSGLNMCATRGRIIGIKGQSGIGKTTLFKLLLGFFEPESGQIFLETVSGRIAVDESTRGVFAYVPQGNTFFSGTLRENVAFASDASDDAIKNVLNICALPDYTDQLDAVLGERGIGLSEGQLQRLAIARALLTDAQIFLLDEFTSALDEPTEEIIMRNIREFNKICILISHKPGTLKYCDTIVELKTD